MFHQVIIVPGLGNENKGHGLLTRWWKVFGTEVYVCGLNWKIEENGFEEKLEKIIGLIDKLYDKNKKLSLIGTSAGGSAVLNAFFARKNKIHKVINICGRLRSGDGLFYSFAQATAKSPSFNESVLRAEKLEPKLTKEDRQKIMTVRPIFDEIVPGETVGIKGAKSIVLPSVEHALSGLFALTLFSHPIIQFIKSDV